jgi:hypothetical protein
LVLGLAMMGYGSIGRDRAPTALRACPFAFAALTGFASSAWSRRQG